MWRQTQTITRFHFIQTTKVSDHQILIGARNSVIIPPRSEPDVHNGRSIGPLNDLFDFLYHFVIRVVSGNGFRYELGCEEADRHRRRRSHPQFDFASVRLIRNRIWSPPNRSEIEFRLFQIDPRTLETPRGRQKSRVEILMSKPPHDKITQIGCSDEGRLWWRDFAGRMICWGDGTHGRVWKWTWYQASGMLTTSACGWIVLVSSSARTRLCRADRRGPSDDRHRTSDDRHRTSNKHRYADSCVDLVGVFGDG